MNVHMWRKRTTQGALDQLRQRGVEVVEPESGYLACGEEGEGRLAEPGQIVAAVLRVLARHNDWRGRRLLITAGATREYIDPVRFISSPASGRTGYLLAEEAARRGAEVFLVSGPTDLPSPFGVTTVRVTSADEMYAACLGLFAKKDFDAAVLTAAVADYRPAVRAAQKLKKTQGLASGETEAARLDLVLNPDILSAISAQKGRCYVVGFAAESENVIENGRAKLLAKGADLIVANDISQDGCGFASWQNRWHLVSVERDEDTGMADKRNLAGLLLDRIAGHLH
ncbi:MAG: bifunctional phosphopantothenoylcysteine decarboxylase/phosphopantothenate--cysteine ligase CoaBC, partial [Coriobacteriia bacterium]|nr:bifunctional phosphopantothenoylcysteine decarboxylase/phosphopantothenate--cysteine ligase CoaBC [Coriobacteriia bacterium]